MKENPQAKIEQRGKVARLVVYVEDHTGDVYRFIHLKT